MQFGSVNLTCAADRDSFIELLGTLDLRPPVVIKPNWGTSVCFVEAEILDWVLTAVDGEALVVESYGWARSEEVLKTGRLGSKKRGDLRSSDEWFLRYSGIGEVLERHGVEFLNVTEENWGHRTVDPAIIKDAVEAVHAPVEMEELYSFVPERLYELRGGDLLSLAKVKLWLDPISVSFTLKNFFGMLPGPGRSRYHGKKHSRLDRSIVDIYKVYDSLFEVKGVVEAVLTASVADPETMKQCVFEDLGYASASKQPLELDAFVTALVGRDPNDIGYLKLAAETFGPWSGETIAQARRSGIDVFSELALI